MGEQLRGAVEGQHRAHRRQPDRRRIPRRGSIGRGDVLKGQECERERGGRDRGHDPEQGPPSVGTGLDAAHRRTERHRPEDAQVHDHRRLSELGRPVAEGQRRHGRDQEQARAQALKHVADDEHGRVLGRRGEHRPDHEQDGVEDHHPALGQVLGQRHREHGAHGVAGVGESGGQAHRLQAHVQVASYEGCDRLERRRQGQVRDEGEDHHRRRGRVAPGQGSLSRHQRHRVRLLRRQPFQGRPPGRRRHERD